MYSQKKCIKLNSNFRAQGTIEYLVILAVVIVISLVVVGLFVGMVNPNQTISISSDIKGKVGVSGISIVESVAGEDGNGLLVLRNLGSDSLTLSKIVVDDIEHNYNEQLIAGDQKSFKLQDLVSCNGESKSYFVKIVYASVNGLNKVSDFSAITIDCTPVVTPIGNFVEENLAGSVGHLCGELSTQGYSIISDCTVISSSGNYILTTDLDCGDLMIAANDVNINGNYCTFNGDMDASNSDGSNDYNAYTRLLLENISIVGNVSANGAESELGISFGGDINLIDSNVRGSIISTGAATQYIQAGNSGAISLVRSFATSIISLGGYMQYGDGGYSGSISVVDSDVNYISSTGGSSGEGDARSFGSISVVDSDVNYIFSSWGNGNSVSGSAGLISISNSNLISIISSGGNSSYGNGASAGSILVSNSDVNYISSTGGSGAFDGGSSSSISVVDSGVNYIFSTGGNGNSESGGAAGLISVSGSDVISINSTGGRNGGEYWTTGVGGLVGLISVSGSDVISINSTGGSCFEYGVGGSSLGVDLENITGITSIVAIGGNCTSGDGGNGGNVTFDICPTPAPTVDTSGGVTEDLDPENYHYNGSSGVITPDTCHS